MQFFVFGIQLNYIKTQCCKRNIFLLHVFFFAAHFQFLQGLPGDLCAHQYSSGYLSTLNIWFCTSHLLQRHTGLTVSREWVAPSQLPTKPNARFWQASQRTKHETGSTFQTRAWGLCAFTTAPNMTVAYAHSANEPARWNGKFQHSRMSTCTIKVNTAT